MTTTQERAPTNGQTAPPLGSIGAMRLHLSTDLNTPIDAVTETFGIVGIKGSGKRLALDTPLATPSGWTTMGDVQVGDLLFDERGQPCRVTSLSPIVMGDARRVAFSDGSEIVADAEHLWYTWDDPARRSEYYTVQRAERGAGQGRDGRPQCQQRCFPSVRTTAEIERTLYVRRDDRNHSIRNALPLALPDAVVPIDPYVLGVWLGDGNSSDSTITVGPGDEETVVRIRRTGHQVVSGQARMRYCVRGLRPLLRQIGVLHNKHIPDAYLRGSVAQRLALLQGLMDTDGGWGAAQAEFAVTSERLARGAYELVVSLGMKASFTKRPARLYGVDCGVSYRVRFTPIMPVFSLRRKAERWRQDTAQQRRRVHRYITGVTPASSVPMRCIAVDSPSHLYLAGQAMIPTHNSTTAKVLVEELTKAGQQCIVIDPLGSWWGLKASADGKAAGLPFTILGGQRADVPITPDAGALIADLVVESDAPLILDLSSMRKGEQRRFMTAMVEQLFHRSNGAKAIHVVVDESDLYIPQRPIKGAEVLVGAMEDLVRRGRFKGIGVSLISQRPASIHKDVLSQVSVLVAHRLVGPQDRAALDAWVQAHGTPERRALMLGTLASQPAGQAWFWSPSWLDIFRQVQVRPPETFDSSATPKAGAKRIEPKVLAPVDIDRLRERMAAVVAKAEANDPTALRREAASLRGTVTRLQTQLATAQQKRPAVETVTVEKIVEVPATPAWIVKALTDISSSISTLLAQLGEAAPGTPRSVARDVPRPAAKDVARRVAGLTKPESAFLNVLAQHPAGRTKVQLAILSGYSLKSSSFGNTLGSLRSAGLITKSGEPICITDEGLAAIGDVTALPAGQELFDYWLSRLGKAERVFLTVMVEQWPKELDRDSLAAATGYSATSSSFGNTLGKLRSLEMVDGWKANDDFVHAVREQR